MPILITGNKRKIIEARAAFKKCGINLLVDQLEIDEIQHHDPLEITRVKAMSAYDALQKPILVNDSNWRIPALNGFPGGYMKDVIQWFTPEDFLALVRDKTDRQIILSDIAAYYDGKTYKTFTYIWEGVFVDTVSDRPGTSLDKVIREKNSTMTLAEEYYLQDTGATNATAMYTGMWIECAEWLNVR